MVGVPFATVVGARVATDAGVPVAARMAVAGTVACRVGMAAVVVRLGLVPTAALTAEDVGLGGGVGDWLEGGTCASGAAPKAAAC